MELTLSGHPTIHVEGTITIELPTYMKLLAEDELKNALVAENRDKLVLAAGRHPSTGDLVFLTGAGELMEVNFNKFVPDPRIVPEAMFPIDHGQAIRIELHELEGVEVDVEWAMRVGHLLINLGRLVHKDGARVTYVDE